MNGRILFLPTIIIYIKKGKIYLIEYDNFKIDSSIECIRENETLPKDATIVKYVWKYANKDGSCDRRYKDNLKIPVCKYCILTITMETFVENIMVSSF